MSGSELQIELDPEESQRIQKMLEYEDLHWKNGKRYIAGVDEAGRGPLAGPVVAAAVVFKENPQIQWVDDSKKLTAEIREELFDIIIDKSLCYGVGIADVSEIDKINIYHASLLAMKRALQNLAIRPEHVLVDGRVFPDSDIPATAIISGDSLCYSIASASILAKVTRDRIMCEYDKKYPQYGFSEHKGYSTPGHLDAIEKHGYCAIHRRSFHPKRFYQTLDLFPDDE